MEEPLKFFVETHVPVSVCNMRCDYCYVKQHNNDRNQLPDFKYSIETMTRATSLQRLGGRAFFNFCANGETLIHRQMPEILASFVKAGHVVRVTTNLTLNEQIGKLLSLVPRELARNLIFCASFHYLELKRLNKLDDYFRNFDAIRAAGAERYAFLTLSDGYLPYLDEISELVDRRGVRLVVVGARDETAEGRYWTKLPQEEYFQRLKEFAERNSSRYFECEQKFYWKKRDEFCRAGEWSFGLNLGTGEFSRCLAFPAEQNIFENLDKPIRWRPVGRGCKMPWCYCGANFLTFGTIPELTDIPTFGDMLGDVLESEELKKLLSVKLRDVRNDDSPRETCWFKRFFGRCGDR